MVWFAMQMFATSSTFPHHQRLAKQSRKKTTCKPNAITSQLTTFAITITIYPSFN